MSASNCKSTTSSLSASALRANRAPAFGSTRNGSSFPAFLARVTGVEDLPMVTLSMLAKKPLAVDFDASLFATRRLDFIDAPPARRERLDAPAVPSPPPRRLFLSGFFSADSVTARAPLASALGASSSSTSRISVDSVTGPGLFSASPVRSEPKFNASPVLREPSRELAGASSSKNASNASSSSSPSHSHRSHLSRRGFRASSVVSFFCTRL